jgi:monoamine oxidase
MKESIIIVGAGAAGLMAARVLGDEGYHVNILEARTRPGGRIDTRFAEGSHPIEAGAEFIHGELPLTDKLIKESGCRKKAMKGKMYQLRHGVVYEDELLNDQWEQFVQALKALDENITIWEFLTQKFPGDEYHVLRTAIKHYVEGYDAADVTLSVQEQFSVNGLQVMRQRNIILKAVTYA